MTRNSKALAACRWESRIKYALNPANTALSSSCHHHYCVLSRFSRVRLFETPWTAAYQAPPSMGFSRQEYWSGLPLPSPLWNVVAAAAAAVRSLQSCPTLCDPINSSPAAINHIAILTFAKTWMDLKIVMLLKVSWTEKDKYMMSLICGIEK